MSLLKNIIDEMYLAMKSGDKEKANTLRTLISKLKDQQIKLRKDISDEESIKIIKTLVKQRKESAEIYSKAGREELAEKENFEISILDNKDSFTEREWKNLYKLSENTFVEETESLKKSAAGAGLTDND